MSGYPIVHRSWRKTVRRWVTLLLVCLLGAAAAVAVRTLLEQVGSSKHTRYEPVDVPPSSVSPRHEREREELERRNQTHSNQGL